VGAGKLLMTLLQVALLMPYNQKNTLARENIIIDGFNDDLQLN
jgi:hypothetical protein